MIISYGILLSIIKNKLSKINFLCELVIKNSFILQHLFERILVLLASDIMKGEETSVKLIAHVLLIKLAVEPLSSSIVLGGPSGSRCPLREDNVEQRLALDIREFIINTLFNHLI